MNIDPGTPMETQDALTALWTDQNGDPAIILGAFKLGVLEGRRQRDILLGPLQRCAHCGQTKHTPARLDSLGGYVCLTCILKDREELRQAIGQHLPELKQIAGQIVCPKDNTFSRMVTDFEKAIQV